MTALRPERGSSGGPWDDDRDGDEDEETRQLSVYRPEGEPEAAERESLTGQSPMGQSPTGRAGQAEQAAAGEAVRQSPGPGLEPVQPPIQASERLRDDDVVESSDTLTLRVPASAFQRPVPDEDVPESSDTLTLRVPASAFQPAPAPAPEEAPVAIGGRAERRRAEQQARGWRGALPGGSPGGSRGRSRTAGQAARQARPARPKESVGIIAVRVLGELFITLGVVMFLFVAYQLWWTNVTADAYASGSAKSLEKQWDPGGGAGTGTGSKDHPPYPSSISHDTKFAIIYIPKLDVMTPIAEGVDKDSILDKGLVGHYTGAQETAFPWDSSGNFALAGHRNTHGEPFRYINKLVPGDKIVVETAYDYYTYTVTSSLAQTSPTDVSVIEPVPPESGFKQPGRYITLTTCTPEFTSKYRMAVWGKLTQDLPKSSGQKPQALQTG
ncbi:class E sortase [Streptacidiphilus cavernicola]|uniref:Class E sortase n=1 Tax=Streptacidiphilus cavernicola TaxID=3342716 RepID=A0ABV6VV79_9ACTN